MADKESRKRSYQLGHRDEFRKGVFTPNRWAWTRNNLGQFVILVEEESDKRESGRTVRLFHPIPRAAPLSLDLTSLTMEEILKMKDLFDSAFEWALPIVQQRDKEAQDAFADGDDSFARVYRQVPQLVYRQRPESPRGEGVLDGPEDAAPVDDTGVDPDGSVRGPSPVVVERDEGAGSPEDDEPEADQPASVQPLVGPPPPAHGLPPANPS